MKKNLCIIFITVLTFIVLIFTACNISNTSDSKLPIYIAGELNNYPCYWFGNRITELNPINSTGCIYSIFVYNGIIYAAGRQSGSACYWEGPNRTLLNDGEYIYSIYVNSNGIYCGGTDTDGACYWFNNTKTILDSEGGRVTGIYAYDGGSVLACGSDSNARACYWRSGRKNPLSNGFIVNSLFIYNNTTYLCGMDLDYNACYWTGLSTSKVSLGYGTANSIYVNADGIYAAGVTSDEPYDGEVVGSPCYWLSAGSNVTEMVLPTSSSGEIIAFDIFVNNGTVYTSGGRDSSSASFTPYFWIGTKSINLSSIKGSAHSIFFLE